MFELAYAIKFHFLSGMVFSIYEVVRVACHAVA